MTTSSLYEPLSIGSMHLKHRVVLAPLTRLRNKAETMSPSELGVEYYAQRASVPGTLLISEGMMVSTRVHGFYPSVPGIWSRDQINDWRRVTDAVHAKGSFIAAQVAGMGRSADKDFVKSFGHDWTGFGDVPLGSGGKVSDRGTGALRAMTVAEIQQTVQDFVQAGKNAVEAGFDSVEIHGANGYLIDQSIQTTSNNRTDQYGGDLQGRMRFVSEIMEGLVRAIGAEKVGLRLSPFSTFQEMGMEDHDLRETFTAIARKARDLGLAYLDLVCDRVEGDGSFSANREGGTEHRTLDWLMEEFLGSDGDANGAIILAGGFSGQTAEQTVDVQYGSRKVAIAFGRQFIANPDLPCRLKNQAALNKYDRSTFYTGSKEGYTDYGFANSSVGVAA